MKIIVDAFGGDNAPLEVIKGSRNAKDDLGVDIALVGDKEKIFSCAAQNKISLTGIDIIDAPDVITMLFISIIIPIQGITILRCIKYPV